MEVQIDFGNKSADVDQPGNAGLSTITTERTTASQKHPKYSPWGANPVAMYRGNLANTGVYHTRAARVFTDEPNWCFSTESSAYYSPVVCRGTVFAFLGESLHAIDLASGRQKWAFNAGTGIYGSPAVGQGAVVLTDVEKKSLIALNCVSGEPLPLDLEENGIFWSPPKIVDNLALIGGWNSVHAVSLSEFQLIGSSWLGGECWCCLISCPVVANGIAYFAAERGAIFGLDPRNGQTVAYEFGSNLFTVHDPVFHKEVIYVFVSESDDPGLDSAPPSTTLLALGTAGSGEFHVHKVANEEVLTSPAVSDSTIYFGCADGVLCALDLDKWSVKWRFQTGGPVRSAPSIAEELIYFGSDDGCVYVLNKNTGSLVSRFRTESSRPVRTSPAICDGVVYFADSAGNLYSWGSPLETLADNDGQQL